jgi:DNA-binding NarL/FixJ family response regulator
VKVGTVLSHMQELAPARVGRPDGGRLTEREYQVAELMALGLTNAAIGNELTITSATVSSHVAHILSKLGFRSRAQVAAWVVGHQLRRPVAGESRD